jgi:LCP family protein required for cell wall assembly
MAPAACSVASSAPAVPNTVAPQGRSRVTAPSSPAPGGAPYRTPPGKPPKRHGVWARGPRWAWLLVIFGALLTVVSGGVLVIVPTAISHYGGKITHSGGLGDAAATGKSIDGPINILLVGLDERTDDPEGGARADSIIVAHVPADHSSVYLASIPRDSLVDIPAFSDTGYLGGQDKINAAFEFGYQKGGGRDKGLELLADTVKNLSGGLEFNGAAIINFGGMQNLIKAIGGINVCVDEKVTSIHVGWNTITGKEGVPYVLNSDGTVAYRKANYRAQVYYPGCQHMNNWQALDYARQRDLLANNDADYGRQRHQQQIIKAILAKTTSTGVITNPVKINSVLNSLGSALSFYNNGVSLTDWIFTLKGINPSKITMIKTNNGKFNSETVNGTSYEKLSDTSLQLFKSMADDDVASFVAANPTWVTPTS